MKKMNENYMKMNEKVKEKNIKKLIIKIDNKKIRKNERKSMKK